MKTQLFAPGFDNIIDLMNLSSDKETIPAVVENAHWYPLKKIQIN